MPASCLGVQPDGKDFGLAGVAIRGCRQLTCKRPDRELCLTFRKPAQASVIGSLPGCVAPDTTLTALRCLAVIPSLRVMGVQVPLGSSAQLLRVTAEQLEAMAARGALAGLPRIELRDGVLCQLNPQYRPHLIAKSAVYDALRDALRALGSSLGVASEGSVRIGEREVPMPDVFVWEVHRGAGPVPVEHVRLVVEVSDTTLEDDIGRKRQIYAAGEIPEYWVVDLSGRVVRQYWGPENGSYANEGIVPFGGRLSAATLSGLGIDTVALQDRN